MSVKSRFIVGAVAVPLVCLQFTMLCCVCQVFVCSGREAVAVLDCAYSVTRPAVFVKLWPKTRKRSDTRGFRGYPQSQRECLCTIPVNKAKQGPLFVHAVTGPCGPIRYIYITIPYSDGGRGGWWKDRESQSGYYTPYSMQT